jgi:hypothetical protein
MSKTKTVEPMTAQAMTAQAARGEIVQALRNGCIETWRESNLDRDPHTGEAIDVKWFHGQFVDHVFGLMGAAQEDSFAAAWRIRQMASQVLAAVNAVEPEVLHEAAHLQQLPAIKLPALDVYTPEVLILREFLSLSLDVLRAQRLVEQYEDTYCGAADDLYETRFANWLDAEPGMRRRWAALGCTESDMTAPAQ